MEKNEAQKLILDAINEVVNYKVAGIQATSSTFGLVVDMPVGYEANVQIMGQNYECQLPEHLHSWIQKGDIVIVQDMLNDGQKRIITGKVGSKQESPSLVFEDTKSGRLVSGVEGIFDEGERMDVHLTVEGDNHR